MKRIFTILILITATVIYSGQANAQDGTNPLVNSSHGYSVVPGDAGNTLQWSVAQGVENTDYEINYQNGDTINIKWLTAGTDTLIFTETDAVTGCQTIKKLEVIVQPNTFDVTISDSIIACNSADGQVNFTGPNTTTSVAFTVDMATGIGTWSPDWEISFTLNSATGATISNVAATGGSLSGTGPYTLTGLTSSGGSGSVDISMDVTGNAFTQQTVEMVIQSATELQYSTPGLGNGNWQSLSVVNAIPQTSDISAN